MLDLDALKSAVREASSLSFGTVEDVDPIEFDPDLGPLVNVALQPSRVPARCRVAMRSAGAGEGDYHPLMPGDEVIVAMPGRSARGECAILGRLPNSIDKFPASVAGQDSTKNLFSFARHRCAHFEEYAGPWSVMSRPAEADEPFSFISLSKEGAVTLRDGSKGALQLSSQAFGYASGDGKSLLQFDLSKPSLTIRADDALLVLRAGGPGAVQSPGALTLASAGNAAHEHAISTEAVCNLIVNVLKALGAANPGPITGAVLGGISDTVVAAAIPLAAVAPLLPTVSGAIQLAFSASAQKPPGAPGFGQSLPGIGCPGTMVG